MEFAVLSFNDVVEPTILDAHVVEVDTFEDMSLSLFRDIFYHGSDFFEINTNGQSNFLSLTNATIHGNPLSIPKLVLQYYKDDLGVYSMDCIDPCSRMEITNQLSKIKSLNQDCNIVCALKFEEIIRCLIQSFPEKEFVAFKTNEYHKFVISIRFTNINEDVKDIIFHINYSVQINDNSVDYNNVVKPLVEHHNKTNCSK